MKKYQPTFETQKLARTYVLDIPAPRGQITDRNGAPLAQNKLSYTLAIIYPTPLDFSDAQVLAFARERIARAAKSYSAARLKISDDADPAALPQSRGSAVRDRAEPHGRRSTTRSMETLPQGMIAAADLSCALIRTARLAGQIIGYTGKTGRNPDGVIENHEVLWPETEGREGLEQTFNDMLTGQHGEYKLTFDKDGRKTSEKIVTPPVPGYNVVTTLDLHLQELAEKALEAKAKRGAIVIIDPNNGDILALASWPTYDPNVFRSVDFDGEIQGVAGRSEYSAPAARLSFCLSAGIDLQSGGRNRRARERRGHAGRSYSTACPRSRSAT